MGESYNSTSSLLLFAPPKFTTSYTDMDGDNDDDDDGNTDDEMKVKD